MSLPSAAASDAAATVAGRLAAIRARVARACRAAGRAPQDVTLVAVSKTYAEPHILAALNAGQHRFGENRVQEARAKFLALRPAHPDLVLHLIGALQTNKARDAVRLADVIESVDRARLVDAIADAAQREGRLPAVLIQVNVGGEPQKAGVPRDGADALIALCRRRFGERLAGLMCIPPEAGDPAPHFTWLATCAARHGLATLSMGMSADFGTAIACGATEIRVGSAIFGSRV